MIYDVLKNMNQ